MASAALPPLDVATVLSLRASVKRHTAIVNTNAATLITYSVAEGAFVLCAYGRVMAMSADPLPLAACLINERAAPGFIARLLDTAEPPDIAALDPAGRQAHERRQRALTAEIAAHADADRLAAERHAQALDPLKLELDDML